MKTLKHIFLLTLLFSASTLNAQTDQATTTRIVEAQNYVFVATTAYPLNAMDINNVMSRLPGYNGGGNINLSGSNYDLSVTKDSLTAYLPYFGRSFVPKIGSGSDDSGIKFKTKKFDYTSKVNKKGGWDVKIKPRDIKDRYTLALAITTNGYATLTVNNNNQQPISFYGYLAETKPKSK